jgi:hypothetical protein
LNSLNAQIEIQTLKGLKSSFLLTVNYDVKLGQKVQVQSSGASLQLNYFDSKGFIFLVTSAMVIASEPENQSFWQEKVLFITKKTDSRVPSLLKMQGSSRLKNDWQKIQIFSFSSWNKNFELKE